MRAASCVLRKFGNKRLKRHEFKPDAEAVIAAARERLGLELKLVRRPVNILEVNQVSR